MLFIGWIGLDHQGVPVPVALHTELVVQPPVHGTGSDHMGG